MFLFKKRPGTLSKKRRKNMERPGTLSKKIRKIFQSHTKIPN